MSRRSPVWAAILLTVACGKEGPPLPPLRLVPEPPASVVARRAADQVRFTFVVPAKNINGPGPVSLERIEIYGATVAAGAMIPRASELMTPKNIVGTIEVRQPPPKDAKPEAAPEKKPGDTRPGPGEPATFVEVLDAAKLKPVYTEVEPEPVVPVTAEPKPATPPAPAAAHVVKRVYFIRGIAPGGRGGQASGRIEIPLDELPPAPSALSAKFTAEAITLAWTPPPAAEGAAAPRFNVYQGDSPTPLNAAPIDTASFERAGIELGKEECFTVRTVRMAGTVAIESTASERACVTPSDTFPPAPPKGLSSAPGTGFVSLIWDANTEADLAGYIVLRGEAPGDTLQPLTPAPIKETTFRDTTVKAGVRYVYAIVAVDNATPPNRSGQSARVEETAR